MPYEVVSEANEWKYIETLIAAKNLYFLIRRKSMEEQILDNKKEAKFNVLHINVFTQDYFHTIVLFDDIRNSILFCGIIF